MPVTLNSSIEQIFAEQIAIHGSIATLWVATGRQITEWCNFSIARQAETHKISHMVSGVSNGKPASDWRRMEPIEKVFKKIGSDNKDDSESEAKIEAAERLPSVSTSLR